MLKKQLLLEDPGLAPASLPVTSEHFLPARLQRWNNTWLSAGIWEPHLIRQLGRRTRAAATPMIISGLPAQQLT